MSDVIDRARERAEHLRIVTGNVEGYSQEQRKEFAREATDLDRACDIVFNAGATINALASWSRGAGAAAEMKDERIAVYLWSKSIEGERATAYSVIARCLARAGKANGQAPK